LGVIRVLAWLADQGSTESDALTALLISLEAEVPAVLVIDMMVKPDLAPSAQDALTDDIRQHAKFGGGSMFLMKGAPAIFDFAAVGPDEANLLCRANDRSPGRAVPSADAPDKRPSLNVWHRLKYAGG
jgi:hypothetical protein